MSNYDNTNRGVLFKNDRKETESHPDYTGKIHVGEVEHYLSAWIKKSQGGKTFMSLSLGKPVEATTGQSSANAQPNGSTRNQNANAQPSQNGTGNTQSGLDDWEDSSIPF